MNELVQTMRGALTLEDDAFTSMRDAENSFARGLVIRLRLWSTIRGT